LTRITNNFIFKFIVFSFVVFTACKSKFDDKQLIESFLTNYIVKDTPITENQLKSYFYINEEKKQVKIKIIKEFIKNYKKDFVYSDNYKIISYNKIDKSTKFFKEVLYINKDHIYYVILKNEIKMFFIVKNQKIISFFGNITIPKKESISKKDRIKPFML